MAASWSAVKFTRLGCREAGEDSKKSARLEVRARFRRGNLSAMQKGRRSGPLRNVTGLERGFDFEAPGFQKRLRDVLRILILPHPFTQPGGANVLIRRECDLLDPAQTQ